MLTLGGRIQGDDDLVKYRHNFQQMEAGGFKLMVFVALGLRRWPQIVNQ